jgi:hypothetical protein
MRALGVWLLFAVGCDSHLVRDAAWQRQAASLSGDWNVEMSIRPSGLPGADRSWSRARGVLLLTPNRSVNVELEGASPPTNYGIYDIDFSALGFNPSGTLVPGVFVGVGRGDSIVVVFESDRAGFSMRMAGPVASDSIGGSWYAAESRNTIATGSFLMTRRNK